jgi:DNA-binding NarL/FixJ family response regulator
VVRVETLARGAATRSAGTLTGRKMQVLRLVATGMANRAITAELFLTEKTMHPAQPGASRREEPRHVHRQR